MARVLVADDDGLSCTATKALLERLGHDALATPEATVGASAAQQHPDLVLHRLHGPDGTAIVADLRSRPETFDTPVVFYSAPAELPPATTRYDAWGHLSLPLDAEAVERLLRRALGPAPASEPVDAVRRNVRAAFHDYWNLLAALANYVQVLQGARKPSPEAERAIEGLDDLMLRLESKTDRLRTFAIGLVDSLEPDAPPAPAEPRPPPSPPVPGKAQAGRPKGPPRSVP